jgi:hypothetical protein
MIFCSLFAWRRQRRRRRRQRRRQSSKYQIRFWLLSGGRFEMCCKAVQHARDTTEKLIDPIVSREANFEVIRWSQLC